MRIRIDTGNGAFHDHDHDGDDDRATALECARILRALADRLESDGMPPTDSEYRLRDINGNHVGYCDSGAFRIKRPS